MGTTSDEHAGLGALPDTVTVLVDPGTLASAKESLQSAHEEVKRTAVDASYIQRDMQLALRSLDKIKKIINDPDANIPVEIQLAIHNELTRAELVLDTHCSTWSSQIAITMNQLVPVLDKCKGFLKSLKKTVLQSDGGGGGDRKQEAAPIVCVDATPVPGGGADGRDPYRQGGGDGRDPYRQGGGDGRDPYRQGGTNLSSEFAAAAGASSVDAVPPTQPPPFEVKPPATMQECPAPTGKAFMEYIFSPYELQQIQYDPSNLKVFDFFEYISNDNKRTLLVKVLKKFAKLHWQGFPLKPNGSSYSFYTAPYNNKEYKVKFLLYLCGAKGVQYVHNGIRLFGRDDNGNRLPDNVPVDGTAGAAGGGGGN